jgi:F420-0:gamma-glutamyl ligase
LTALVKNAEKAFEEFDYESALSVASTVISRCDEMIYSLIESKPVQNRAVWYRSNEKSDAEVRATLEKLNMLITERYNKKVR